MELDYYAFKKWKKSGKKPYRGKTIKPKRPKKAPAQPLRRNPRRNVPIVDYYEPELEEDNYLCT